LLQLHYLYRCSVSVSIPNSSDAGTNVGYVVSACTNPAYQLLDVLSKALVHEGIYEGVDGGVKGDQGD